MEATKLRLLFFFVLYLVAFPTLRANIAQFDQVWQERSQHAKSAALQAYRPNPEQVTVDFNKHVNEYVFLSLLCCKNMKQLIFIFKEKSILA